MKCFNARSICGNRKHYFVYRYFVLYASEMENIFNFHVPVVHFHFLDVSPINCPSPQAYKPKSLRHSSAPDFLQVLVYLPSPLSTLNTVRFPKSSPVNTTHQFIQTMGNSWHIIYIQTIAVFISIEESQILDPSSVWLHVCANLLHSTSSIFSVLYAYKDIEKLWRIYYFLVVLLCSHVCWTVKFRHIK